MGAKKFVKQAFKQVDRAVCKFYLRLFPEKNSLLTFLFHGIFIDEKEIALNYVDPQQRLTVAHFRQFVDYYVSRGYVFVSPDDILKGLNADKKYVLITFDDGYFNNQYAVPILNEYKVPAVFFISTNNVKFNKSFWWDVTYRQRIRQGVSPENILKEELSIKTSTAAQIEEYIIRQFGPQAFSPVSDIDRPFTPGELRDFAQEKYVFLGNHTADHAILTNYSIEGIHEQIVGCQNDLKEMTGVTPEIISFPNGNYSDDVVNISKQVGLKLGITIEPKKNYLPLNLQQDTAIRLGRFVLMGDQELIAQCESFRSDIDLYNKIKNLLKRKPGAN